jgi:nicotinamidase-related amidase
VVLVDTGIPGRADKITSVIEEAQRRIGEVHTILLTHWHPTTSAAWPSCVADPAPESWPMRSMHR